MTTPDVNAFDVLARNPVLIGLPESVQIELSQAARIEHHEQARALSLAGVPLTTLRLVVKGHIEIIARHPSGNEVALGDIGIGGWATWVACLSPLVPDHDFVSSPDSVYLALPAALVRRVCHDHPALYPRVIADLGVRMRQLMEWTGESVLMPAEQRMAKLIHLLARMHGLSGQKAVLRVTQTRLGRLARCSRQSANGLLSALEQRGLIAIAYGGVEIADLDRLSAFVAEDLDS